MDAATVRITSSNGQTLDLPTNYSADDVRRLFGVYPQGVLKDSTGILVNTLSQGTPPYQFVLPLQPATQGPQGATIGLYFGSQVDYLALPPYQGTGFKAPLFETTEGWKMVTHPLFQKIMDKIQTKKNGIKLAISGRRRLGKSVALAQVGKALHDQKKPFFFIEAQNSWDAMQLWLVFAIPTFDPALSKVEFTPTNQLQFVNFISWLLRSGVVVVIDEFQLLTLVPGFENFLRSEIDQRGPTWKGPFVVLGSHVTEIERIIDSTVSPLYGRNFDRLYAQPWTFAEIYKLLAPYQLDPKTLLGLYTCFDGIVAFYEQSFISGFNLGSAISSVKKIEPFYSDQLSTIHSGCLRALSEKDCKPITQVYDHIPQRTSLKRHSIIQVLADLNRYGFIVQQKPWLESKENKEIVKIIDCPLRVQSVVPEGGDEKNNQFFDLQGRVFEEVCRTLIKETKCLGASAEIIDKYWAEHCTEIDVVAEDKTNKIVYWGSCKRNGEEHSPWNQLCHVISFFNNRGKTHEWYTWTHCFLFLSPSFSSDKRTVLTTATTQLNEWLQTSNSDEVVRLCAKNLSNWNEGERRSFQPSQLPDCPLSLRVQKCLVFDLSELVAGKQN